MIKTIEQHKKSLQEDKDILERVNLYVILLEMRIKILDFQIRKAEKDYLTDFDSDIYQFKSEDI